eukprot:SAG31_NODE_179_length_21090_cov_11.862871_20_plen_49_part_00
MQLPLEIVPVAVDRFSWIRNVSLLELHGEGPHYLPHMQCDCTLSSDTV